MVAYVEMAPAIKHCSVHRNNAKMNRIKARDLSL